MEAMNRQTLRHYLFMNTCVFSFCTFHYFEKKRKLIFDFSCVKETHRLEGRGKKGDNGKRKYYVKY